MAGVGSKGRGRRITPASAAREAANLSLVDAARKARVCARYLRHVELHGRTPYALAVRLSKLYKCPMTHFLYARFGGR